MPRIEPVFYVLSLVAMLLTGIAMSSEVSILAVYAGIAATTTSLLVGWDRAERRCPRR